MKTKTHNCYCLDSKNRNLSMYYFSTGRSPCSINIELKLWDTITLRMLSVIFFKWWILTVAALITGNTVKLKVHSFQSTQTEHNRKT